MASSEAFPAADTEKDLNPGMNKDFQVDPVSSDIATTKEIKEILEAKKIKERKLREDEEEAALQRFKTTLIISGIVVAVAGAVFAITKKLREK